MSDDHRSSKVIVEMAGAPAAGKSTILVEVQRACAALGVDTATVEDLARPWVRSMRMGRLLRFVPSPRLRRRMEWQVFAVSRAVVGLWSIVVRPGLAAVLWQTQRGRPAGALARRRRAVRWFIRTLGTRSLLDRSDFHDVVVLIDEGVVHRTVQLFTSPVESAAPDTVRRYVANVPAPHVVVHVQADIAVCTARALERGARPHWGWTHDSEIAAYISHATDAVRLTIDAIEQLGVPVVGVDNNTDVAHDLVDRLRPILCGDGERADR